MADTTSSGLVTYRSYCGEPMGRSSETLRRKAFPRNAVEARELRPPIPSLPKIARDLRGNRPPGLDAGLFDPFPQTRSRLLLLPAHGSTAAPTWSLQIADHHPRSPAGPTASGFPRSRQAG